MRFSYDFPSAVPGPIDTNTNTTRAIKQIVYLYKLLNSIIDPNINETLKSFQPTFEHMNNASLFVIKCVVH